MEHKRLSPEPRLLYDFYETAFNRLGAITERPWHDRLLVLAEGSAARVWPDGGDVVEAEIRFPPSESTSRRDASREVFPGCPLTFQLVEAILRDVPARFRQVIGEAEPKAPERAVAEKLLRQQLELGSTTRLTLGEFRQTWHFSAVAVVRAEVVAIDQSWHALRLAFDLETGELDPHLEKELEFLPRNGAPGRPEWPMIDEARFCEMFRSSLLRDLAEPLARVRERQERHLCRELERISEYFSGYRAELRNRLKRQRTEKSRERYRERIEATEGEEKRRRDDQVHRHEIRLVPHVDALLLTAERAWKAKVDLPGGGLSATLLPRARRWFGV